MPNVATVLKEEIRRLARKEVKAATKPLAKALANERREIAALRKELSRRPHASAAPGRAVASAKQSAAAPSGAAWRKDTVRTTRDRLGITQSQFAKLVGVSNITVSFWETGRSTPRAKQQAAILGLQSMSPDSARAKLGPAGARKKPGPKPGSKRGRPKGQKKAKKAGRRAKKA